MRLYIAFSFLVIVLLQSCGTTKTFSSDDLIIEMEKTVCFGACPVYTLSVYKDRTVLLNAQQNLSMEGTFRSQLSADRYNSLVDLFLKNDFFGLEDRYVADVTDLPTTYVTFRYDGQTKRVMDYYGAPEKLKAIENSLHELIEELDWERTKERD